MELLTKGIFNEYNNTHYWVYAYFKDRISYYDEAYIISNFNNLNLHDLCNIHNNYNNYLSRHNSYSKRISDYSNNNFSYKHIKNKIAQMKISDYDYIE